MIDRSEVSGVERRALDFPSRRVLAAYNNASAIVHEAINMLAKLIATVFSSVLDVLPA